MSELNEKLATAWEGFTKGDWQNEVNVRDFIQKNYTPYEGDESFLAGATEATTTLWDKVMEGVKLENRTHAPCTPQLHLQGFGANREAKKPFFLSSFSSIIELFIFK